MYWDSLSGDNDDAKYYDKWRVGVPMLEIIGRISKYCTLPFGDTLWILGEKQNIILRCTYDKR